MGHLIAGISMSVKFVIVGAPRTGSTLLVKTLNSLDGVCCHGELLNVPMVRGYEDGFDLLTASGRRGSPGCCRKETVTPSVLFSGHCQAAMRRPALKRFTMRY